MAEPIGNVALVGVLLAFMWLLFLTSWMLMHAGNFWRSHDEAKAAEPPYLPSEVIGGPNQEIGPSLVWDRKLSQEHVNQSPSGAEPTAKVRA